MKLLFALFGIVFVTGVFAQDDAVTTGVAERVTCSDIQEQITELSELQELDEDSEKQLTKLKNDFRVKCSRRAGKRKTSASGRVIIQATTEKTEQVVSTVYVAGSDAEKVDLAETTTEVADVATVDTEAAPVEQTAEEVVVAEEIDEEALLEQELAYLDAGLCADGTSPNKFGCCGDEIFRDLGNTVFACCPKTGGDCFPPIEKKE